MNRLEWKESTTALRELLKEFSLTERPPNVEGALYKFGIFWWNNRKMWIIYNGVSDNVIATIKRVGGNLTIRYRKNSKYAYIFENRTKGWEGFRVARIPSETLGRHRQLARDNIGRGVRRQIEAHRVEETHEVEDRRPMITLNVPIDFSSAFIQAEDVQSFYDYNLERMYTEWNTVRQTGEVTNDV